MKTTSIGAFLISDRTRIGSQTLEAQLRQILPVSLIAPIYLTPSEVNNPLIVNRAAFRAHHLRLPAHGEIGCALAHRAAQLQLIEETLTWGLVFEDDAILDDYLGFEERFGLYKQTLEVAHPVVINLNVNAIPQPKRDRNQDRVGLTSVRVGPYPATAYAINRAAAALFVRNQNPVRRHADWPASSPDVSFFIDTRSSIREAAQVPSRIDAVQQRKGIPWTRKALAWSGLWYLMNRQHFDSFRNYWNAIPRERLSFHAHRVVEWRGDFDKWRGR